jgi:uncharacterized membrane protein
MSDRNQGVPTSVVTPADRERGQVLVWTAVLLPLMLVLVGLVFDGGLLWVQYRQARWAADGAAVAAASEIDPAWYADTGQVKLKPGTAAGAAVHFAQLNNPNLHVQSIYVQAGAVRVQGWAEVRPVFLGMFGVGPLQIQVTGRERPAWGIDGRGQ